MLGTCDYGYECRYVILSSCPTYKELIEIKTIHTYLTLGHDFASDRMFFSVFSMTDTQNVCCFRFDKKWVVDKHVGLEASS